MSWEKTHRVLVNDVTAKQLWRVWEDVNHWNEWDDDIDFARLQEPFQVGSHFKLKPKGGPTVKIQLIKVETEAAFTDVTRFPFAKMYGIHEMKPTSKGLEVSHTVRIEGPLAFLWKKLVAEKVAAGLDSQAEKMIEKLLKVGDWTQAT